MFRIIVIWMNCNHEWYVLTFAMTNVLIIEDSTKTDADG